MLYFVRKEFTKMNKSGLIKNKSKINHTAKNAVGAAAKYLILASVGYIYLQPIITMLLGSVMSPEDLANPTVKWWPTELCFTNYKEAYETLDFLKSFANSLLTSVFPMLFQTITAAFVGFGFARFEFPLKKMWMAILVATFIIPSQVTLVPRYVLYYQYGIINTVLPAYLPSLFGQGIKSALFILVFYQFFRTYPISFDEAAELDGAGKITVFTKIAIPMGIPAIVVSLLFSFIWYWNETSQSNLYFGAKITTLPMRLQQFTAIFESLYGAAEGSSGLNNAIIFAGTTLSILPVIILYLVFQRQFVESIEKSGITGE